MRSTWRNTFLLGALTVSLLNVCWSRQFAVPGDFGSITEAIHNVESPVDPALSDTILVAPGRYEETITLRKNVRLLSRFALTSDSADLESTFIIGDSVHPAITIIGPCSPLIAGFQIRSGGGVQGAGITLTHQATATIQDCAIKFCESGIACLSASNSTIQRNIISENRHPFGGDALYINLSNPTLTGNLISDNSGHGLEINSFSSVTVTDCRIIGNGSTGVYARGASLRLTRCEVIGNRDDAVGGVFFNRGSHGFVLNCTIQDNVGGDYGGLACVESDPEIANCRILENVGGSVGGLYCGINSTPFIRECVIALNESRGAWGGVRFSESTASLEDCEIHDNTSQRGCAGIYLNRSRAILVRCQVFNHLSQTGGGAIQMTGSELNMQNCTFFNNSVRSEGGGVVAEGWNLLSIRNSILWQQSQPIFKLTSWGEYPLAQTSLNMNYCDVGPGVDTLVTEGVVTVTWGGDNFCRDPLFVNNQLPDLTLSDESPCIDRGDPNSELDADGTPIDLGAIFYPQPNLSLSTNWVSFPNIHPNEIGRRNLDVSNIGLLPLNVSSIEFASDGAFQLEGDAPVSPYILNAGDIKTYQIVFSPHDFREHRGVFIVNSNDRSQPRAVVFIQGTALSAPGDVNPAPVEFALRGAWPNPFNANLNVEFDLPAGGIAKVELFDSFGRLALPAIDVQGRAGRNTLCICGDQIPGGAYLLCVQQGPNRAVLLVSLVK